MNESMNFEIFLNKKFIKFNYLVVLILTMLLLLTSFFENNLFLYDEGIGLLEHINIWIFITSNILILLIINKSCFKLKKLIENHLYDSIKSNFNIIFKNKLMNVLRNFVFVIGFCFFVGNTLQNAQFINILPFDYWDSSRYFFSFLISRIYKFYLFSYFIPFILIYILTNILTILEVLKQMRNEIIEYPVKQNNQAYVLCNFSLNIILSIVLPIMLISSGVYYVHDRFDVTSIATIIISVLCTILFVCLYLLLVTRYFVIIENYKTLHTNKLETELVNINESILKLKKIDKNYVVLQILLEKERYLWNCKERVSKTSNFPLKTKAFLTGVISSLPTLIEVFSSTFKNMF